MAELSDLQVACFNLEEKLIEANGEDKIKVIHEHLNQVKALNYKVPNFPEGLEWMNIGTPLSWETNLRGKIVVLDFFTYCCINCMHVLPDLEELERCYTIDDGVVIIGVHSAKFDTEKISANIRNAILRYNITHPVLNDESAVLWETLQIQCWPTFVVVGPDGNILNMYIGEGHRGKLIQFVGESLKYYAQMEQILHHGLKIELEKNKELERVLSFPGKICCSNDGEMIAVTDSGHNRVLVLSKEGIVKNCFGGKEKGFRDGPAGECRFNSPQGLTFGDSDTLYIADTENHAVRKISLSSGRVTTLIGTGVQGSDKEGGSIGTEQEISSPWDVVFGRSPGSEEDDTLYIAMAGTHQIWAYFLKDVVWYKKREYKAGVSIRFAGSGNEENRNNSYPEKAAFAQPSGLALSTHPDLNMMYVADSESSSIRAVQMKDGAVKALVGAERDPKNLFAYGNKDGVGIEAKLKHPLGVALVTETEGPLLIADTYNSQIKIVDIKTKSCTTYAGDDVKLPVHVKLNEPSGLCVDRINQLVYVTDTNIHTVKVISLKDKTVRELNIQLEEEIKPQKAKRIKKKDVIKGEIKTNPVYSICTDLRLSVCLHINFKDGSHLNEEAPSSWILYLDKTKDDEVEILSKGSLLESHQKKDGCLIKDLKIPNVDGSNCVLYLKCKVFYCERDSTCRMSERVFQQDLILSKESENKSQEIAFTMYV